MTRNAKAKGRLGQQEVRDKLLETFPDLEPDDIKSTIMGDSGEDIQLSPAARKIIPLTIRLYGTGFKSCKRRACCILPFRQEALGCYDWDGTLHEFIKGMG